MCISSLAFRENGETGRQAIGRKETFPEPRRRTGPQQPRHKSLIGSQQILVDLPALKGLTKRRPEKLGFSHLSQEQDLGEREKPGGPANPETARRFPECGVI